MARDRNPETSAAAFLGAELRRARLAAGMSQDQLARLTGFDRTVITKAETGERPPTEEVAAALGEALGLDAVMARLAVLARKSRGPYPDWFVDWVEAEKVAWTLWFWAPLLVPGMLQTEAYARAILAADPECGDDLDDRVRGRLERQQVLARDRPPVLTVIADEAVLHRCIGGPKVMHDQLVHLAEVSERPRVYVHVIPAEVGTHAGLMGAASLADLDHDGTGIVYLDAIARPQTVEDPEVVSQVRLTINALRAEALPRGATRELIMKVAEQQWS
jgi:transcriptional regulator with XRE-family HTH domain